MYIFIQNLLLARKYAFIYTYMHTVYYLFEKNIYYTFKYKE